MSKLEIIIMDEPTNALIRNTISQQSIWVFIVMSIVCTLAGAWWFTKRDIAA